MQWRFRLACACDGRVLSASGCGFCVCVCVTLGVSSHAGLTVTRCTGKDGGGIAISEGSPRIQRMVFSGNSAQLSGGAINLEASAANITVIQARSGVVGLR